MKKTIGFILSFLICLLAVLPGSARGTGEETSGIPECGSCVPNQALVLFRTSLTAEEKAEALERSLGDGWNLLDLLEFDEDLAVALVESGRLNTEEMLRSLSGNPEIGSVQANWILQPQSAGYSVNDPLNAYCWYAHSPETENMSGDSVSDRGLGLDQYVSLNADAVWNRLTGDEDEVVVAVVDTGIRSTHEDLKDVIWTNPGVPGLPGEHGYNFADHTSDLNDLAGHGTHCAGIIAARANNGAGIAGVGSAANVKIMMVATYNADPERNGTPLNSYREIGAFHYILRAKQGGVNIVATSSSWGRSGQSDVFDEIIDRLGEEGIVSFVAAGNEFTNLDYQPYTPAGGNSPYKVVVGAADLDGRPSAFSNFGRCKVDLFAPGVNILSTVSYPCYFPNLWTPEKRSATTAYYGVFDGNTGIENGTVIPSAADCDETVKTFGAAVFHVQPLYSDGNGTFSSEATCSFEIVKDHIFTETGASASLKVTIHNAGPGEAYYLYFPYEKDPETNGTGNTDLSICVTHDTREGDLPANLYPGEVVVDGDGTCSLTLDGYEDPVLGIQNNGIMLHACNAQTSEGSSLVCSAEELDDRQCGIGLMVLPCPDDPDERGDFHFYLDSIAVSKTGIELSADDAYDVMSGTSMATPAAAGAYALLASLYPRQEGQSGAEYALENRARLFSCIRRTEELEDLCASGGWLDLSLLDGEHPALTRAVCDPEHGDVILSGINLQPEYTLAYTKYAREDARAVPLPDGGMTAEFSADGKTAVIHGAKELFGCCVEFTVSDGEGVRAKTDDFLVKGMPQPEKVYERLNPALSAEEGKAGMRCILTDEAGKQLYGYDPGSGILYRYDGTQFAEVPGTGLTEAMFLYLKEQGAGSYELHFNYTIEAEEDDEPAAAGNRLFRRVKTVYSPAGDADEADRTMRWYLASMDYTAQKPEWTFTETRALSEIFGIGEMTDCRLTGLDGKIYCTGIAPSPDNGDGAEPFMFSYDPAAGTWSREAGLPVNRTEWMLAAGGGKLYAVLGIRTTEKNGHEITDRPGEVWRYDGTQWEPLPGIPYLGDNPEEDTFISERASGAFAVTEDGLLFISCPAEGGGNCFLYHPEDGNIEPLYCSLDGYKADNSQYGSCAITEAGVYYFEESNQDGDQTVSRLYLLPAAAP